MDDRVADMAERWAEGETLQSIGASYGITRERVRQLMKQAGLATAADARAARRHRREVELADDRERLLAWLVDHPGQTRQAAAAALDLSPGRVGHLLGAEAGMYFVSERAQAEVLTDEEILAGLRAAAIVHGDPLAADRYDEYSPAHGLASSVRIIQRWGTWNAACRAAGLTTHSGRSHYHRQWTESEMLEYVADYLTSEGSRGTYAGYDAFARSREGAPSAQTVRNTFRDWAGAKRAALHLVAARQRRQRVAD